MNVLSLYESAPPRVKGHVRLRWKSCPFEPIEKKVPTTGRILDVGCGHGLFVFFCALMSPQRFLTGVDVDSEKVMAAQQVMASNESLVDRMTFAVHEGIPAGPWDCITVIDVLYLLRDEDKQSLVRAASQALTEGGVLLIKEIAKRPFLKYAFAYLQELLAVKVLRLTAGRTVRFANLPEVMKWMKEEGLTVQSQRIDRGYLHPHHLVSGTR